MAASPHTEIPDVAPRPSPRVELRGGAGSSSLGGRRRSPSNMIEVGMALFRRSELKAAEADVVNLTGRLDSLRARMAGAAERAEAAVTEQRRLLVETAGADAAALRRAGEACRRAQDDHAAYLEAEAELVRLLDAAQARVAAEHDRIERERVAAEMTAKADHLAACIAAEEAAVRALAEAHQATRLAAYAAIRGIGPAIDAESLIGEVKAVALHMAYPIEFHTAPFSRSLAAPCCTIGAAASSYLDRLRSDAEAVRLGTTSVGVAA